MQFSRATSDYYCCSKSRDFGDTHKAFWRGLRLDGIGQAKAYVMWLAVRTFGPDYWDVDPTLEPQTPCKGGDSVLSGMDAQTIGIVAGKLVAFARTLETTGGTVVDVVNGNPIFVGSEQVEEHLDYLHSAAKQKFDGPRERLGLFSSVEKADLQFLPANNVDEVGFLIWDLNSVPELEKFVPEDTRARYGVYKMENVSLSSPEQDIYQASFWMPAYEAFYVPTIKN